MLSGDLAQLLPGRHYVRASGSGSLQSKEQGQQRRVQQRPLAGERGSRASGLGFIQSGLGLQLSHSVHRVLPHSRRWCYEQCKAARTACTGSCMILQMPNMLSCVLCALLAGRQALC